MVAVRCDVLIVRHGVKHKRRTMGCDSSKEAQVLANHKTAAKGSAEGDLHEGDDDEVAEGTYKFIDSIY